MQQPHPEDTTEKEFSQVVLSFPTATPPSLSADGGAPAGEAPAADSEGTLFVTRPPLDTSPNDSPARLLIAGIDTLEFGVFVEFGRDWSKIVARLAKLKRSARGTGGQPIAHGRCIILPGGKQNYPYLIQFPGFSIYLSRKAKPDGQTPNVYVSLKSQFLWEFGESAAMDAVLKALGELAPGEVRECRMSRCDLAADLLIPEGLTDTELRQHAVGFSRSFRSYIEGDQLETLYVGSGQSPVQLRIYDKSLEIAVTEKFWFLPLWGMESNGHVWRFEFQLRRPFLKSAGVNSLDDLVQKRAILWAYLTTSWFSLRELDNDNTSRRSILPLWQIVQSAGDRFGIAQETLKRSRQMPSHQTDSVVRQMASLLVGYGARAGIADVDGAIAGICKELEQAVNPSEFVKAYQKKTIQLGIEHREDAA